MQDLLICLKTLWGPTSRITSKLYYRKANHSWKLIGKGRLVKLWWLWVSGVTHLGPWWVNLYAQTKPNQTEPKPKQTKTHSHQKTPTTNLKQTPTKGKKKGGRGWRCFVLIQQNSSDFLYSFWSFSQIWIPVFQTMSRYILSQAHLAVSRKGFRVPLSSSNDTPGPGLGHSLSNKYSWILTLPGYLIPRDTYTLTYTHTHRLTNIHPVELGK